MPEIGMEPPHLVVEPGLIESKVLIDRKVVPDGYSEEAARQIRQNLEGIALNTLEGETGELYRDLINLSVKYQMRMLREAADRVRAGSKGKIDVKIEDLTIPEIFVVPEEKRYLVEEVKDRFGNEITLNCSGFWSGERRLGTVYALGDILKNADSISHEVSHGLSNSLSVQKLEEENGKGAFKASRIGYYYVNYREGTLVRRGLMLEESLAVEAGVGFLESTEIRQAHQSLYEQYLAEHEWNGKDVADNFSESQFGEKGDYFLYWKILHKLVEGVNEVGNDDVAMMDLISLSRCEPKLRRLVRDKCDQVFGRGTFREIWQLGEEENQTERLERMLDWLNLDEMGVVDVVDREPGLDSRKSDLVARDHTWYGGSDSPKIVEAVTKVWNRLLIMPPDKVDRQLMDKLWAAGYGGQVKDREGLLDELLVLYQNRGNKEIVGVMKLGMEGDDWFINREFMEGYGSQVREITNVGTGEKCWCGTGNDAGILRWADLLGRIKDTGLTITAKDIKLRNGSFLLFMESLDLNKWQRFDRVKQSFDSYQLIDLANQMGELAQAVNEAEYAFPQMNPSNEFYVDTTEEKLKLRACDLSDCSDEMGYKERLMRQGMNMEWVFRNFLWALVGDQVGDLSKKEMQAVWDSLEKQDDLEAHQVIDALLIRVTGQSLSEVKPKVLAKLGGENAGERYLNLGRVYNEAWHAIRMLKNDQQPDSDWVADIPSLTARLGEVLAFSPIAAERQS